MGQFADEGEGEWLFQMCCLAHHSQPGDVRIMYMHLYACFVTDSQNCSTSALYGHFIVSPHMRWQHGKCNSESRAVLMLQKSANKPPSSMQYITNWVIVTMCNLTVSLWNTSCTAHLWRWYNVFFCGQPSLGIHVLPMFAIGGSPFFFSIIGSLPWLG